MPKPNKIFAVVGFAHEGITSLPKEAIKHNHEMVIIEKASCNGSTQSQTVDIEKLAAELDRLASASMVAKDGVFKLGKAGNKIEFDKIKKIHPRHQHQNKYREKWK